MAGVRHATFQAAAGEEVDGAATLLMDRDGVLRFAMATGSSVQLLTTAEELCVEGPAHEAFTTASDVVSPNIRGDGRWPRLVTLLATAPAYSVFATPIIRNGVAVGALATFAERHDWVPADMSHLRSSASEIACSLQHGNATEDADDLERMVDHAQRTVQPTVVLHDAAKLVADRTGVPVSTAALRLRQVAAILGQPLPVMAHRLVTDGRLFSPSDVDATTEISGLRSAVDIPERRDSLSDLVTRTVFLDRLAQVMERSDRGVARPAVISIDIDRFHRINDSLGHEVGDQVLSDVARRLRSAVPKTAILGRMGGEEFAVLCDGSDDNDSVMHVAERAAAAITAPIPVEVKHNEPRPDPSAWILRLKASIGVTSSCVEGTSARDVLRNAELARNQVKDRGGNGIEVFGAVTTNSCTRRIRMEMDLRDALESHQAPHEPSVSGAPPGLRVFYQPIFDLHTKQVIALEALARYRHPKLGPIAASEFISLAEDTGLISPLGTAILHDACQCAARWRSIDDNLTISVNVSPRQLSDASFADVVRSALRSADLPPSSLCLELTESHLLEAASEATGVLDELGRDGVHISLDDFGTGYSSLSYLSRLPVDKLKIDQSFVGGLGVTDHDGAVVQAVISLAHALGLLTIAEGVETEAQASVLASLGCNQAQGYLFSKPVPPSRVEELLTRSC